MEIQTDNPNEGYPFPCFSYDTNKSVVLNTGYILCSHTVDVKYLLGVLNSSLGKFLVKSYVTQLQKKQFRMLAQYVNIMPIPFPIKKQSDRIILLVNNILSHHSRQDEDAINEIVYDIFKLNEDERIFIQSQQNQ